MTALLVCYYILIGLVVTPVLILAEVAELSDEDALRLLWAVMKARIA